jgi:hypothetical protein
MNEPVKIERLLTRKTALGETKLECAEEGIRLAGPEFVAKIRAFAITTNNWSNRTPYFPIYGAIC